MSLTLTHRVLSARLRARQLGADLPTATAQADPAATPDRAGRDAASASAVTSPAPDATEHPDGAGVPALDMPLADVAGTDLAGTDVAGTGVAGTDVASADVARTEVPRTGAPRAAADVDPETGMATAEYAIATVAAAGFAGLLIVILRSGEVRELLLGIIRSALSL
jgi:hypothetical protein